MSNSLQPHGIYSLWDSPGQNTGVGSLSLLQGIFPAQGSNPGLRHCGQILYQLSHKESPYICAIEEQCKLFNLKTILHSWNFLRTPNIFSLYRLHIVTFIILEIRHKNIYSFNITIINPLHVNLKIYFLKI